MKSRCVKPSGNKVTQVYVQTPRLRPTITHVAVKAPEHKTELVQVRVRMTKENTNANPKNKSTQTKGRPAKS